MVNTIGGGFGISTGAESPLPPQAAHNNAQAVRPSSVLGFIPRLTGTRNRAPDVPSENFLLGSIVCIVSINRARFNQSNERANSNFPGA
jgi:hypothetical protein